MKFKVLFLFLISFLFCETPNWDKERQKMIEKLKEYGIRNQKVLSVMSEIPRHKFIPEYYRSYAYEDTPLPIGFNQTISQPYIVALMTELLDIQPEDKILEIGTGSGYQAAVLGKLSKEVYTIEIIEELCSRSQKILKELQFNNIQVICGDGYEGYKEKAPYDKILLTAAPKELPEELLKQLKINGILVAPIGDVKEIQILYKFTKTKEGLKKESVIPVRFVPMIKKK